MIRQVVASQADFPLFIAIEETWESLIQLTCYTGLYLQGKY